MEFDNLFDKSDLSYVLKQAKTISKEECRAVYNYMKVLRPKKILEFGTQFGCSTRCFIEIAKWLNYPMELHSWDIVDRVRKDCVNRKDFKFHLEDVTKYESKIIEKYIPNLVFLDAHPYFLTKNIISKCIESKIDIMMHDIAIEIYDELKSVSNNFLDKNVYGAWELYVMSELISPKLLIADSYEDNSLSVRFFRDRFGLGIVEFKNDIS